MPMIGPFSGWVTDHDIGTSGAGRVELDVPRSGDRLFATSDRVRLYVPEEGSWHRLGNGFLTGHGMGPGGSGSPADTAQYSVSYPRRVRSVWPRLDLGRGAGGFGAILSR